MTAGEETPRLLAACVVALVLLAGTGCASRNQAIDAPVSDPLEPVNRAVYVFNDTADRYVLRPVAVGYTKAFPTQIRGGVHNFISNLSYPVVVANDFLQGKFKVAGQDTARFLINSIVGLAGLFDPATEIGLPEHDEDFGQTLGKWGVSAGPFLMLPLLGPSTVRDTTGLVVDLPLTPFTYVSDGDWQVKWGYVAVWAIDKRSRLLDVDEQVRQAYDPYLFVRDAYIQNRRFKIADGNVQESEPEVYPEDDVDEPGKDTDAAPE